MRISRTIVMLIALVATFVLQMLGIDVPVTEPEVGEGGITLMAMLEWVFAILAAVFRVKASEKTTNLGVKTGEPLGG